MPEEKDFELSPRIEELQEKLTKDPKSRIFLQLAEEYRKSGMPEEAITVCQEGLKHHPGYVSAKVTLGKAYLDLKKVDEAQQIFEDVIEQAHDNLMANRNLGDIYYMKGFSEEALKHYKVINMFNPNDQFVADRINEISAQVAEPEPIAVGEISKEKEAEVEEKAEIEPTALEQEEVEAPAELFLEEEIAKEEPTEEIQPEPEPIAVSEVSEEKEPEVVPEERIEIEPAIEEPKEAEAVELILEEEPAKKEEEIDLEKYKTTQKYIPVEMEKKEKIPPAAEAPIVEEVKEELPQEELAKEEEEAPSVVETPLMDEIAIEGEGIPEVQIDLTTEEVTEEEATPKVEIDLTDEEAEVAAPEIAIEKGAKVEEKALEPEEKEIESATLAELYAKQGLIDKAIETYQRLLQKDPETLWIKARLEQLIIKRDRQQDIQAVKPPEAKEEKPPAAKEEAQEAKPSEPLDEEKKEKIDTLSKWLENIKKLK